MVAWYTSLWWAPTLGTNYSKDNTRNCAVSQQQTPHCWPHCIATIFQPLSKAVAVFDCPVCWCLVSPALDWVRAAIRTLRTLQPAAANINWAGLDPHIFVKDSTLWMGCGFPSSPRNVLWASQYAFLNYTSLNQFWHLKLINKLLSKKDRFHYVLLTVTIPTTSLSLVSFKTFHKINSIFWSGYF